MDFNPQDMVLYQCLVAPIFRSKKDETSEQTKNEWQVF